MVLKVITKSLVIVVLSIIVGCNSNSKQIDTKSSMPSIEITNILQDSISIRALDYADGKYWFAGSQGKFGFVETSTDSLILNKIDLENNLEFRSLAISANYTYILSAGNPALIYKISHSKDSLELVYTERGENVFYDSMKFWNDDEGIAMGDPQSGCFSIIKTTDGGKTWQKIECGQMPKAESGEAAFAASNSNIAIHGDQVWFVTGGNHARVFHSKDRGENWEAFGTPIISGKQMTGIYAVDFIDEKTGIAIGGDWNKKDSNQKNKAITQDGGKTWHLSSDGEGPGYCSDIMFIPQTDGNELLAVGSPGIWWSGNRGEDWFKLSDEGFYTLTMINSTEGVLAGRNRLSKFRLKR